VSTYDPANVLATVTSHRRGLPLCHGIRDNYYYYYYYYYY